MLDDLDDVVPHGGQHGAHRLPGQFVGRADADHPDVAGHRLAAGILDHFVLVVVDVPRGARRGHLHGAGDALVVHHDGERASGRAADDAGRLRPGIDRARVDADDRVARFQPGASTRRRRVARFTALALAGGGQEAGVDAADRGAELLHAEAAEHHPEQHDRDDEVHERTAAHDDDALIDREPVEGAVLVAVLNGVRVGAARILHQGLEEPGARRAGFLAGVHRREHPGHRNVAAKRQWP